MSISKWTVATVVLTLCATTGRAATRCNLNPGGPEELVLTVPSAGSDFDAGWTGEVHDFDVPTGARFALCLANCDNDTDPLCDVQGQADQLSAAGRAFAPPIPVVIGSTAVCIQANFADPAVTGTVNLQTGAMSATANLAANVFLTSLTNVCPQCIAGTCNGGTNAGAACTVGETVNVEGATGDTSYDVSIDCPAGGGTPIPVALTVNVGTGQVTAPTCAGQSDPDDCSGTCVVGNCTGAAGGGIRQSCCSNDTSKSCFTYPVTRQGAASPALPAWPDSTYPKEEASAAATLVGAFCAPGAPGFLGIGVNSQVGLPGPAAFILPINQELTGDSDADGLPDTLDGCTFDGDCDDDGLLDGSLGPEDTNNDGVVDTGESDPTRQDSDSDGLPDGLERGLTAPQKPADFGGTLVPDADPASTTDPANADTDGDGFDDGEEDANKNGRVDAAESDPNDPNDPGGPAGGCSTPGECNDNDPCTDDSCPADTCVFVQKTGAAGAQCELDQVQDGGPICGTDQLDAKTDKAVTKALTKVEGLLAKIATATGKKKTKLVKKAKNALKVAQTKATKAGSKGKISADCSATIVATMTELSAIVGAL